MGSKGSLQSVDNTVAKHHRGAMYMTLGCWTLADFVQPLHTWTVTTHPLNHEMTAASTAMELAMAPQLEIRYSDTSLGGTNMGWKPR